MRLQTVSRRGSLRERPTVPIKQTPIFPEESQAGVLQAPLIKAPQRGSLRKPVSPARKDRTKIGDLNVPHLGIGTIAWTANDEESRLRIDGIAARARGESQKKNGTR